MRDGSLYLALGNCIINKTKFDMVQQICDTPTDDFRHFLTEKGKWLANTDIKTYVRDQISNGNYGIYLNNSQGEYAITSTLDICDVFRRATRRWPVYIVRVDGDPRNFFGDRSCP